MPPTTDAASGGEPEETPEETEAKLREEIAADPEDSEGYFALGNFLLQVGGREDEAEEAFRRATVIDPRQHAAFYNLGVVLRGQPGREGEAIEAFRGAIAALPNMAAAHQNLGELLAVKGEYAAAEKEFREAIAGHARYLQAYLDLALVLSKQEGREDEAEKMYREALAIDPYNSTGYLELGILLSRLPGREAEAEAAYRESNRLYPDSKPCFYLGLLLSNDLEREDEAEAMYRQAIAIEPDSAAVYYNLAGLMFLNKERVGEAEAAYRKVIELQSDYYLDAHFNLGVLLRMTGRAKEAIAMYTVAAQGETEPAATIALVVLNREIGNEAGVKEFEAQARGAIPVDDWYNLACLESSLRNTEAALEDLRRAAAANALDAAYARIDLDLEWVRQDPRFWEIVVDKTNTDPA